MTKSAVAGIIDHGGGYRVVVASLEDMPSHVGEGERLVVVEGLLVQEPVQGIGHIKSLIQIVEEHLRANGYRGPSAL